MLHEKGHFLTADERMNVLVAFGILCSVLCFVSLAYFSMVEEQHHRNRRSLENPNAAVMGVEEVN